MSDLFTDEQREAMRLEGIKVQALHAQLTEAGLPVVSVSVAEQGYVVTYADGTTTEQIAAGDVIVADFDGEAAIAAHEAAQQLSAFDRANIIARANDILAEEAAGQIAANADIATIATGITQTNAATTLAQMKPIVIGILNLLERDIQRSKGHMKATADVVKLVRHTAKG